MNTVHRQGLPKFKGVSVEHEIGVTLPILINLFQKKRELWPPAAILQFIPLAIRVAADTQMQVTDYYNSTLRRMLY